MHVDINDTRSIRALALDAAVRSMHREAVRGGTSHGYLSSPPSPDEILDRAQRFEAYIATGAV